MAVQRSQALSEETSGYIRASCHRARLHWSALISINGHGVREVRGHRTTLRGDECFMRRTLWWIYQTQLHLKYVLLSRWVFIIRPGPFPCWITSVITSPLCSYLQMNTETVLFNRASSQLSYFPCHVCMMYIFKSYHRIYKEEQRIYRGNGSCSSWLNVRCWE